MIDSNELISHYTNGLFHQRVWTLGDAWVVRRIKDMNPLPSVLHIGCGCGYLLEQIPGSKGTELDYNAVPESLKRRVFFGDLLSNHFIPNDSFGVIYMGALLDRVLDPKAYLLRVRKLLKRSGCLFIEVRGRRGGDLLLRTFTSTQIINLLSDSGYKTITVAPLSDGKTIMATPDPTQEEIVSVGVPAGLGDVHWILTKLQSLKNSRRPCKLHLIINDHPPRRAGALVASVPFVDSYEYRTWRSHPYVQASVEYNRDGIDFLLFFNHPLERGERLENILPQYETNWSYPSFPVSPLPVSPPPKVLFYMSCWYTNEIWNDGSWAIEDWVNLSRQLSLLYGSRPVVVGTKLPYHGRDDMDFYLQAYHRGLQADSMIGQTTSAQLLSLLKSCSLVVAVSSGIGMLAVHYRKDTVMLWAEEGVTHSKEPFPAGFQTSWAPPHCSWYLPLSIGSENCTVNTIIDWLIRRRKPKL